MQENRRIVIKYRLDKEVYKKTLKGTLAKHEMYYLFDVILYGEVRILDRRDGTKLILEADLLRFITQLFDVVNASLKNQWYKGEISNMYQDYVFNTKVERGYLILNDLNYTGKFKLKKLRSSLIEFKEEILNDIPLLYPEIKTSKYWNEMIAILKER